MTNTHSQCCILIVHSSSYGLYIKHINAFNAYNVISVVAKLFEGLVHNQLRTFISDNNILVEQQSGFRSQHSTETALLGSTNEWLYNMDSGLIDGALFLDLKKPLTCTVDHEILLKQLHLYGIKGTTHDLNHTSKIENRYV